MGDSLWIFSFATSFYSTLPKGGSQGLRSDRVEWMEISYSVRASMLKFRIFRFFSMG